MTRKKTTYKLKNSLSELNRLCRHLKSFGELIGLSHKDVLEVNLCVEEHFTNIISHGYNDTAVHWIEISFCVEGNRFFVTIEDDGIPFNPTEAPAPDLKCMLEDRRVGGLGVHLTKHFMDEMKYRRCEDHNILTMIKNL